MSIQPRQIQNLTFRFGCLIFLAVTCLPHLATAQLEVLDIREGTGIPAGVQAIYEKGADFLATSQETNGSWEKGNNSHSPETNGVCGLCVMAFLSTGEDPNYGKYAVNIRRSLRHIILKQDNKTGYIGGSMYAHGFAMLALSEAYGAVNDEMLWAGQKESKQQRSIGEALELAVRLAISSQKKNPHKGWRYGPNARDADTSVVGAVLMGLLAARNAGIEVPDDAIDGALEYIKTMTSEESGQVAYSGMGGSNDSQARSSIACLVFAIAKRKDWPEFDATRNYIVGTSLDSTNGEGNWPYYTRYYQAQALFQSDYEAWRKWNIETIDLLHEMQNDDGQIGDESQHGPAYSTSISLLALALNFRFLPIYER